MPERSPLRRVVIALPNWFGETLFVTPFLRALRAMQPQAALSVLGVSRALEMLEHHPLVSERLPLDAGTWTAWRRLCAGRFDAAFILRKSLSRTALMACARIPRRIGWANAKSGWLLTDTVPPPQGPMHKAHAYLRLLSVLGTPPAPEPYDYTPSVEERAWAAAQLQQQEVPTDKPLVVLHPGANWDHKRWPAERFGQLAARLHRGGAAVVISEGPGDGPLTGEILVTAAEPLPVVSGATIRQLAALLERAALVVSNDTGVLHLACALRRPVVALFGPTSPAITGPLGDPSRTVVMHHPNGCPVVPCLQPDHPGHPGMAAITVDDVHAAAARLLQ